MHRNSRQGPQGLFPLLPPLALTLQPWLQWAGCSDHSDWQEHMHSTVMHPSKMPGTVRGASKKERELSTSMVFPTSSSPVPSGAQGRSQEQCSMCSESGPSTVSGVFFQAADIVLPNLKHRWRKPHRECLCPNVTYRCILFSEMIERKRKCI